MANREANALARELADKHARNFDCKTGTPIIVGEQGESIAGMVEQMRRDEAEKKKMPAPSKP